MPAPPAHRAARASILFAAALAAGCSSAPNRAERRLLADLSREGIRPAPHERNEPTHATNTEPAPDPVRLPAHGPIALADLLAVAERNDPSLAAAGASVGAAAARAWQASVYPEPRLDVQAEDVSFSDGFAQAKTTVGVTQPIILGDRRRAAVGEADAGEAADRAVYELRRRDLFGAIAAEHTRLLALREQIAVHHELRRAAEEALAAASARVEARAAPQTDAIRPLVELRRIDAAIARLTHEQSAAARRLAITVGEGEIDPSRLAGALPLDPPALDPGAIERAVLRDHPALLAADRAADAASSRLDRIDAERTPDLDARLAFGYDEQIDDAIVEFGAGIALPLTDARRAAVLAARFDLARARHERDAVERSLRTRIADALGEHDAARAELAAWRDEIVPRALRAFDLTREAYAVGNAPFLELLDAQRTLSDARVALIDLAARAAAARANLAALAGADAPIDSTRTDSPDPSPQFHSEATP